MAKKITILTSCICFLLLTVAFSQAATKGRILSDEKVSLYKSGKVIKRFTGQGPVDENALIACDGTCFVKIKGVSFIAGDQARFAVKESKSAIYLYVETGAVRFAVADISKCFFFYTRDNYLVQSEGFITPASTDNPVKGFMRITDRGTQIGMEQGSMAVTTDEGTKMIGSGQAILLAMADVPEMAIAGAPAARLSTSPALSGKVKNDTANASLTIENLINGFDADTIPGPTIAVGDDVKWEYIVTNNGNVGLRDIRVIDDQKETITCPAAFLAVGSSMTCKESGKAVAGQYEKKVTATGAQPDGAYVTDADYSHYFGSNTTPCPFFSWDCKTTAELAGLTGFGVELVVAGILFEDALSDRGRESASPNQ